MKKKLLAILALNCCLVWASAQPAQQQSTKSQAANVVVSKNNTVSVVKNGTHGTTVKPKAAWKKNPFDYKVFILNQGQCDAAVKNDAVLYSVKMGNTNAYFTNKGVQFQYLETAPIEKGHDPDQDGPPKRTMHYGNVEWVNCNTFAMVDPIDKQSYYQTYDAGNNKTIKTDVFKKIVYRNLYPGIDAEYTFPEDGATEKKYGFEYALIIHPGADLSQVKLKYTGMKHGKIDAGGNAVWTGELGELTDHAPKAYYKGEQGKNIAVSYKLNGDEETFSVANYDKTKTLIIDPWTTDPLFTTFDVAYELDYDYAGNVYVYGGVGYELVKLDNTGAIQWMFTATTLASSGNYLGGMCTDRHSENTYLSEGWNAGIGGAREEKVSTGGILLGTDLGNSQMNEIWRLRWDPCSKSVFGVGDGTGYPYQACQIDTSMSTITLANICAPTVTANGYHDFGAMAFDLAGGNVYTTCSTSLLYPTVFDNYLVKCPIPALTPAVYQVPIHYAVAEFSSYTFDGSQTNGYSGAATSPNWLYVYQGDTLKQINKATGAINAVAKISSTPYKWGGIDGDYADNVYLGNSTNVEEYSPTLALLNTYPMTGTIYDVKINSNTNILYACGSGFVTASSVPVDSNSFVSFTTTPPTICTACNGTATAICNGVPPFTYLWNDGSTNQTDTGLCVGTTYTVIVTDAICERYPDTATVSINGFPVTVKDTNPSCKKSTGNITVYPVGTAPYTYLWSNGNTNQEDTGLIAGTYTCTVTETGGCKSSVVVTLTNPIPPTISISPATGDSICIKDSAQLTASGGKTYTWLPVTGLNCTSCPNPKASPASTTTYTVTGIDSLGCTGTSTVVVTVVPLPTITVSPVKDSICPKGFAILTASGGVTYKWNPGGFTSTTVSVSPTVKTTYTVVGTNKNGCKDSAMVTVSIIPTPKITVVPSAPSICQGSSVALNASAPGGVSYTWTPATGLTCTNCPNPTANPTTTTTYTVTAFNGVCTGDTTIVVTVNNSPTAGLTGNSTVCIGKDTTLTATGGGTYLWSTGATTSSIIANPSTTQSYSVMVTSVDGCKDSAFTSVAVDVPNMNVCCDTSIILGTSVILTASGSTVAYVWTPEGTLSCFTCPNPTASPTEDITYTVVGTDANGCSVEKTLTIDILCTDFKVPNVFTPNGDLFNQQFVIINAMDVVLDSYTINIYDRWGKVIFTSHSYAAADSWTGKTESGAEAPDGVYYYIINATCGKNLYKKQGFVQLIR
ncbi:MAG TPA: gliding motility-associated C-terminal domain-containing protein [Bacteroidia bacterium]|jgi:gliding motility-associated-like protein|nr:gliding motility-associated C-terminal domain-containing protein [Bacteroidia bacterium]